MSFEAFIRDAAHQSPEKETCGLVFRDSTGELYAETRPNMAETPADFFRIDAKEFLAAKNAGNLVGYWHSHPFGSCKPSAADKSVAEAVGLPSWVYSVRDNELHCYTPSGWRAPLEGRAFVPHVHDCVSLVWDYFADKGVELSPLPRVEAEYTHGISYNWKVLVEEHRAQILPQLPPPKVGDIIVMILGASHKPNHLGVYVGNGLMLHQTRRGTSRTVTWEGYWKRHTTFLIRLP